MKHLWLKWYKFRYRVERWFDFHMPVRCAACGEWKFRKDTRPAQSTIVGWVRVCDDCHKNLYPDQYRTQVD